MYRFPILLFIIFTLIVKTYSQTIHFMAVADVSDTSMAMVSNRSIAQVSQIFETIALNLNYNFNNKYGVPRKDFNSTTIISKISQMATKPNDIIVFYYSGKGYYPANSKSEYPFFDLNDKNDNPFSQDELGELLLKKGVRLSIAMADCRNQKLALEFPEFQKQDRRPLVSIANKNKIIVENLINGTCGLVKIASNSRNEKANVIKPIEWREVGNSKKWTAFISPFEHSVFSYAFYDVFDFILKESNESITFPNLIRAIQYRVNYELNPTDATKRKQNLKWNIIPCTEKPDNQSFIWTNLPNTYNTLATKLDQLLDIEDKNTRQEFIQNLAEVFDNKNQVTYKVKRKIRPDIPANNKTEQEFPDLKTYLNRIVNFNSKIQSIKIYQVSNLNDSILPFKTIFLEEFYNY